MNNFSYLIVILLTLNKSKKIVIFADFEQIKKIIILLTLDKSKTKKIVTLTLTLTLGKSKNFFRFAEFERVKKDCHFC